MEACCTFCTVENVDMPSLYLVPRKMFRLHIVNTESFIPTRKYEESSTGDTNKTTVRTGVS